MQNGIHEQHFVCPDDKAGSLLPDDGDSLFINVGDRLKSEKSLLEEYNPQLRVQENADGVQRMFDIFSFKIGLGKGFYKLDEDGMVKTATEYTGSKQGLVRNVAREMIGIEAALKQLIEAVLWIGENVLYILVCLEEDVRVIADDSYIVDEYTERKVWQEEVARGLRRKLNIANASWVNQIKGLKPSCNERRNNDAN